jgi:multimeric flavodoxin WrbA
VAPCTESSAAFTSSATQHGGNETTLFSIIANLVHFGMVIVGPALLATPAK